MGEQETSKFSPDAALKFLLTSEAIDDDLTMVLEVLNDDKVLALYCLTMETVDVRVRRLTALARRHRGCLRSALSHFQSLGNGRLNVPRELEKFKERLVKLSHLATALEPKVMRIVQARGVMQPPPRRFL